MCFNMFIIGNHEKGTSIEIGSSEGGVGEGRGLGVVTVERKKRKSVCVRVSLCPC